MYQKWDGRTRSIARILHYLKGSTVLDIGSNAGLLTSIASLYSHKAVGIDMRKHYHKQSMALARALQFDNLTFKCCRLVDFVNSNRFSSYGINAVLAARVLYHLSDPDVKALRARVLPSCTHVIAISRENKGKSNNKYNLHKSVNIANMLKADGFAVTNLGKHGPDVILLGQR